MRVVAKKRRSEEFGSGGLGSIGSEELESGVEVGGVWVEVGEIGVGGSRSKGLVGKGWIGGGRVWGRVRRVGVLGRDTILLPTLSRTPHLSFSQPNILSTLLHPQAHFSTHLLPTPFPNPTPFAPNPTPFPHLSPHPKHTFPHPKHTSTHLFPIPHTYPYFPTSFAPTPTPFPHLSPHPKHIFPRPKHTSTRLLPIPHTYPYFPTLPTHLPHLPLPPFTVPTHFPTNFFHISPILDSTSPTTKNYPIPHHQYSLKFSILPHSSPLLLLCLLVLSVICGLQTACKQVVAAN